MLNNPGGFQVSYAPYNETVQLENIKKIEKSDLKKTSNGLGLFILIYFLTMQFISILFSEIIKDNSSLYINDIYAVMFIVQMIASTGSAFIAVVLYRLISRKRMSETFTKSHVKFTYLLPLIFLGMGAAMAANMMASVFADNISVFGLKNSADHSISTKSSLEMILYIVSTSLIPAFAEELAFRGVFMNVMRKYGDAFAIITSSLMFGAMHGNTTQIIFAFTLGLIFAYIDCKANSIIPSVIVHFLNNFYAVAMDILQTDSTISDMVYTLIYTIVVTMFCLLGILSFIYLSRSEKNFFKMSNKDANPFSKSDVLSMKEKIHYFILSPGILIPLSLFAAEVIFYLLPANIQINIMENLF